MVGLPLSPLVEMRGLTAAPVEFSCGRRWRVSDDPMRHVFRMAAWNALGWPVLPALGPRWRPALFSLSEEDARADGTTRGDLRDYSGKLSYLPADAHGAARGRFLPHLERVEEEATHLFEAENATSSEPLGREVATDLSEAPWTSVDGKFPASSSPRSASADLPFALQNRFELLEVEGDVLNNLKSVPSSWLKWFPETAWSCPRHWLNMLQLRVFNTKKIGPCCTRSVRKHTR